MAGTHDLALFVLSGLLLNITPGQDTLYIVGRSAAQGREAGVLAALGIGAGCCVHALAAALGLSAVLAASATAFTVIKLAGAAYLVYLGVTMLRTRRVAQHACAAALGPATPRVVFLQGMLTNVLNPKVALFFLAFLPQFVAPDAARSVLPFLFLGVLFNANATLWNLFVACFAAGLARRFRGAPRATAWLHRAAGALFVGLGIRLAFAERG